MLEMAELSEGVYWVRGSPSTLVVLDGERGYVVDPGSSRERGKDMRKALERLGVRRVEVVLTHGHPDHVLALRTLKPERVYATGYEAVATGSLAFRNWSSFSFPFHRQSDILLFRAGEEEVTDVIKAGDRVGPLETVPLPGHTYGQIGVYVDGLLYAADSVFGDRLLRKVGVPFFQDHRLALETMRGLTRYECLVVSHGPVVRGEEVKELVEQNVKWLGMLEEIVRKLIVRPLGVDELTLSVLRELGAETSPPYLMLAATTVRSILAMLYDGGEAEPVCTDEGLKWVIPG